MTVSPESFSFFVGELEKCLEDHEHLPELFIKHVSGTMTMMIKMMMMMMMIYLTWNYFSFLLL